MAYDRADWHYGGEFPDGLPPENGGTHIGMFLGWAIKRGLVGNLHAEHGADAVAAVCDGTLSGRAFLMQQCDEKFTDENLSVEGNRFAESYYDSRYLDDYDASLGADLESLYHVQDHPKNHTKIELLLDKRFGEWRAAGLEARQPITPKLSSSNSRPWWRFW